MKKLLVSSAIILLCLSTANAKVYETLVLSDGFKLQGYIMERIPGESMTMDVESIIGSIDKSYIENYQDVVKNNVPMMTITLNDEGIEALGGDADTMGAITGAIAGAYYGTMPYALHEFGMAKLPDDIKDVLSKFDYNHGGMVSCYWRPPEYNAE